MDPYHNHAGGEPACGFYRPEERHHPLRRRIGTMLRDPNVKHSSNNQFPFCTGLLTRLEEYTEPLHSCRSPLQTRLISIQPLYVGVGLRKLGEGDAVPSPKQTWNPKQKGFLQATVLVKGVHREFMLFWEQCTWFAQSRCRRIVRGILASTPKPRA